jgi:hypothetical protein
MREHEDMDQPVGSALRYGRALILAAVAMAFGVVAHVTAGGLLPGAEGLAVLLLPLFAVNAWLLERPASALRLCVMLVLEQTFVHGGLTSTAGHAGQALQPGPAGGSDAAASSALGSRLAEAGDRTGSFQELAHGVHATGSATLAVPAPVQHLLADMTGPHAVMAVAHVLAAVAVGLWLACGERALWTVLGLSLRGIRTAMAHRVAVLDLAARAGMVAGVPAVRSPPMGHEHALPPRLALTCRVVWHRGPPALLPV